MIDNGIEKVNLGQVTALYLASLSLRSAWRPLGYVKLGCVPSIPLCSGLTKPHATYYWAAAGGVSVLKLGNWQVQRG